MKISFYMDKGKNFENSLEKTHEMLIKFQEEMSKVGTKYKQQLENEEKMLSKSQNIDKAMIMLVQKVFHSFNRQTEELKAEIVEINRLKAEESKTCKL